MLFARYAKCRAYIMGLRCFIYVFLLSYLYVLFLSCLYVLFLSCFYVLTIERCCLVKKFEDSV